MMNMQEETSTARSFDGEGTFQYRRQPTDSLESSVLPYPQTNVKDSPPSSGD